MTKMPSPWRREYDADDSAENLEMFYVTDSAIHVLQFSSTYCLVQKYGLEFSSNRDLISSLQLTARDSLSSAPTGHISVYQNSSGKDQVGVCLSYQSDTDDRIDIFATVTGDDDTVESEVRFSVTDYTSCEAINSAQDDYIYVVTRKDSDGHLLLLKIATTGTV